MTSRTHELQRAEDLARKLHANQVDKAGAPYWTHCQRVAAKLSDPAAKIVAWLHDVLEDTDLDQDTLRTEFDAPIVDAIVAMTRIENEPQQAYYERVRANALAREVKLADVHDNLDPHRLVLLDPPIRYRLIAKYGRTLVAMFDTSGEA